MILWKEWRQQKWLFLLWCLAGIAFPVLEAYTTWKRNGNMRSDIGTGVILGFGAMFAMILAVATTNSDTKKGPCEFWQSKPVSPRRLFVVKFLVAASLLLISFLLILSLDFFTTPFFADFAWAAFCCTYPIALMLFAITMFLTILLRDSAKAILMAIWMGLLVYCLPLLIGGLEWMNIFHQMDNSTNNSIITKLFDLPRFNPDYQKPMLYWLQRAWDSMDQKAFWQYWGFLITTLGIACGCVALSVASVKRRWFWQPGQKTIVWTIGLSAAFIFGLGLRQAGHNLRPVEIFHGKPVVSFMRLDTQAEKTYDWIDAEVAEEMITMRQVTGYDSHAYVKDEFMYLISRNPAPHPWWPDEPPQDPDSAAYNADRYDTPVRHDWLLDIYQHPAVQGEGKHLARVRFFSTPPIKRSETQPVVACFIRNGRLYVGYRPGIGENNQWPRSYQHSERPLKFLVVDISNPAEPKLISNEVIHKPRNFWGQRKTGLSNYGDYCYVAYDSELHIISVANPDQPELIKTLTTKDLSIPVPHDYDYVSVVDGDKLICHDQNNVLLLDISKPTEPEKIFYGKFEADSSSDIINAVTSFDKKIFIARKSGIYVYQLRKESDGTVTSERIGKRRATPLERLLSRYPKQLIVNEGLLLEAACGFGILVYDISDPTRPHRVFHGGDGKFIDTIGFWDGLLYAGNFSYYSDPLLSFLEIPKANSDR